MPKLVIKGGANITIRYDASGRKWSQTGTEGIREYVGGIEYLDQKIQSVQHGEGRLVAAYNTGGTAIESIRAEYWRQDHLGNTRVAFSDLNLDGVIATKDDPGTTENDVEITQENHYYPFGLNHEGPWYQTVQPKNKYTYNGKEYVEDLGLNWNDYGARWYDPAVGRFFSLDPIASNYPDFSPFSYAANSPINNVDFLGLGPSVADMIVGSWLQTKEGEDRSFTFDELEAETGQGDDDCCGGNKFNILPGDGTRGAAMNAQLERAFFEENKSQEELIAGWEAQGEGAIEAVSFIGGNIIFGGIVRGGKLLFWSIRAKKVAKVAKGGFSSFNAFKKVYGSAGKGNAWHHIVEQHADNIAKFGAESIHNPNNLIKLPSGAGSIHAKVTGYYNSLMPGTSMRVRDYVKTLSYEHQYQFGIDVLKRFGWRP